MIYSPMGGADVVLRVQWLQSLGTIAFNFQELFIKFSMEGKEVELRGIAGKPGKIISSDTKCYEPTQEKIEKIDQRLRIQPLRGGNFLYIT